MKKEWALLTFMAADNDLYTAAKAKREQLRDTGELEHVSVVIQLDGPNGAEFELVGPSESLQSLGSVNSGEKETLVKFIRAASSVAPSTRSFLLIFNHGRGLDPEHLPSATALSGAGGATVSKVRSMLGAASSRLASTIFVKAVALHASAQVSIRSIAEDWPSGDYLDNRELRDAILEGMSKTSDAKLDIVGFEACLMNSLEIAYEIRNAARFVIGSQSDAPIEGWSYDEILRVLHPSYETRNAARAIVRTAMRNARADQPTSLAALDLSKADHLARRISSLAASMLRRLDQDAIFDAVKYAHYLAQPFGESETVDLVDFCRQLTARVDDPTIRREALHVEDAAFAFVVESHTRGARVQNAHGLSIYFPKRNYITSTYPNLEFAQDTSWLAFLRTYLAKLFGSVASHDGHTHGTAAAVGGGHLTHAPAAQKHD